MIELNNTALHHELIRQGFNLVLDDNHNLTECSKTLTLFNFKVLPNQSKDALVGNWIYDIHNRITTYVYGIENHVSCCPHLLTLEVNYYLEIGATNNDFLIIEPTQAFIEKYFDNRLLYKEELDAITTFENYSAMKDYIKPLTCAKCGKVLSFSDVDSYIDDETGEKIYMCSSCFNRTVRYCPRCDNAFLIPENYNDCLCPKCHPRHFVAPYHLYTPALEFKYIKETTNPLYLGIEFEVDNGGERNNIAGNIMDIVNEDVDHPFIYCSHDGSLSRGFEIITQPATYDFHKQMSDKYTKMFDYLYLNNYSSHDTSTCGLHIHINRTYFIGSNCKKGALYRICYLMHKYWTDFVLFSRRDSRFMSTSPNGNHGYALPIPDDIEQYVQDANHNFDDHYYHYYSVNLQNDNTIEFRIFRGTMNTNTILASLKLVENIAKIAHDTDNNTIKSITFNDIIGTDRNLKRYWKTRKLTKEKTLPLEE